MSTQLTTERLREFASGPKCQADLLDGEGCDEFVMQRNAIAAELLAKRKECEALQRESDESRDLIASAMHDVGERSFLEDAQRILRGCVAPYSCEQMKAVADALRQWRDKWAILLEMLVRSNEERDAAREACERKHQDGWAWLQLSQQREAERDAARAEAKLLQGIIDDDESESGLYDLQIDEAAMEELPTLPDFVRGMRAEAEKLRAELADMKKRLAVTASLLSRSGLDVMEKQRDIACANADAMAAELDAVKRQRDEASVKMGELAKWARGHAKNSERWETYQLEVWRVVATEIGSAIKMLAIYSQPAQQPKPEVQP